MMKRRFATAGILMVARLILVPWRAAPANEIMLAVGIRDGLYYGKISGEVADVTQVRMWRDDPNDYDLFEQYGDEFWLYSPQVADIATLNEAITGNYFLGIDHPGGTSVYSFAVQSVEASQVPNEPALQSVPSAIPPQYTFAWTWSGTADARIVELEGWEGDRFSPTEFFWRSEVFWSSDPGFDALTYDADFADHRGSASFKIIYGNLMTDLVTDWSLVSGDDLFDAGANLMQVTEAVARAEFQVVPKPATLALLAVAVAGLILRRLGR